ncbi:hypothetical protein M434DRAFT_400641 [Hypoxylon sp. CO27-5]|nr:hypothetical protein M434DRAFT_400641 [Hypoxylon sp. CO27-5]
MATMKSFSRPTTIAELVRRLRESNSNPDSEPKIERKNDPGEQKPASERYEVLRMKQEAAALRALSRSMIHTFHTNPNNAYAAEAASLSPFADPESYQILFQTFTNLIATGSGDCGVPDIKLLTSFNAILHYTQAKHIDKRLPLGHAILSLKNRLTTANFAGDDSIRYQLLRTLSAILDAMNEIKFEGISDAEVVQPLLDLLEDASKHRELRLSQAAQYAYQALRGIPSDVSPWGKLWTSAYKTFKASATLASSVSSLDPAKLLEGLEGLGEAAKLVKTITDAIDSLSDLSSNATDIYKGTKGLMKPAQWYYALRYTDLLIRGRGSVLLKSLLESPRFLFKQDKNFLCGLCAQLEEAVGEDPNPVVPVIAEFLHQQVTISKSQRVHKWVWLTTSHTTEHPKPKKRSIFKRLRNKLSSGAHTYCTTVGYQTMLLQIPGSELLNEAWPTCHEAQVFYADQVIRDQYTDEALEQLKVERLGTNGSLSMEQCYINLAIWQGDTETGKGNESITPPSLSLHHRLAIWEPEESSRVSLPDLFQPMSDSKSHHVSSTAEQPCHKRVLIRGQAGVGKSTLCKKMVYDCIYRGMWADIIDRVIWLPLRQLKGQEKQKYDVQRLLHERYYKNRQDGNLLANALNTAFESNKSRTLFILDGLDEVLQEVSSGDSDLFRLLLHQPRVIVTTRPYAANVHQLENIDRRVETIGFYRSQVKEYIDAVSPNNAAAIQDFLKSHPVIAGLARIPVQLDAVCYSFEAGAFKDGNAPQTMTELYIAIEQAMWKKDVVRLEKYRQGRPEVISKSDAWRSNPNDVQTLVQGELNVLQALAFDGFSRNIQEFDSKFLNSFWEYRNTLTKYLPKPEIPAWSGDLDKFSLLRTSDGQLVTNRSYHFIHLTVQEYFAAKFFVQHWPDRRLPGFEISAEEFLRKEKYNPRFDIIWRFVAGLLHAQGRAKTFFETIEGKPYDLLGPVHGRLIVHCLAETVQSRDTEDFGKLRGDQEDRLKKWLLYECHPSKYYCSLAAKMEFPDTLLRDCLSGAPEFFQNSILRSLRDRPILSPSIVDYLTGCLGESEPSALKVGALRVFAYGRSALPESLFHEVVTLLKDTESDVGFVAAITLAKQRVFPNTIFQKLVALLKEPDAKVQNNAIEAIKNCSSLAREILLGSLQDLDAINLDMAVEILTKQSVCTQEVILELLGLLQDSNVSEKRRELGYYVACHLNEHIVPSPTIVEKLLAVMGNVYHGALSEVAERLKSWDFEDRQEILQKLLALVKDSGNSDRHDAVFILAELDDMPTKILKEIGDLLNHAERNVRSAAVEILSQRELAFPKTILQEISNLLNIHERRQDAMKILTRQYNLPENILQELMDLSEHSEPDVRSAAMDILNKQRLPFPNTILQRIVSYLDDPERRPGYLKALIRQESLPEHVVQKLLAQFRDPATRNGQQIVLNQQLVISHKVLEDLVELLQSPDPELRSVAKYLLRGQSSLPKGIIESTAELLSHVNKDIRDSASIALSEQASLPEQVLHKVLRYYYDLDCFAKRKILPPKSSVKFRSAMEQLSRDYDLSHYSLTNVSQILIKQKADLSEKILDEFIDLLKGRFGNTKGIAMSFWNSKKQVLQKRILREVPYLLNHPDEKTQYVAVKILEESRQSDLEQNDLQRLVALWKKSGDEIFNKVEWILERRSALPDTVLQDLAAKLNDPDRFLRHAAAGILSKQSVMSDATFTSLLSQMDRQSFNNLYGFWLRESFVRHLTWLTDGETAVINLPGGEKSVPLNQFKDAIREARATLGVPFRDFNEVL